ncbi:MAG: helix-turn-helix transcriptional regulator [Burkholderiales bacterium]|nr:helix-turn-helix transcriptional regulator [Burkholderiales bacterium]
MTGVITGGGLVVNTADHAPRMIVPKHEHANAYLCVIVAGAFELTADKVLDCPAGSVISYPEGHVHANRFFEAPSRCVNIHLSDRWLDDPMLKRWLADCRQVRLPPSAHAVMRLAREVAAHDNAAPLAVASAAIELMADAMRLADASGPAAWLGRIVDIIEADLANAPTLNHLAREVGMDPAHTARAFRQAYGETIGEYVRRRRVEMAQRVLASDKSLADIAIEVGFADQAHFTRVFRQYFGVSPGAARRAMQA